MSEFKGTKGEWKISKDRYNLIEDVEGSPIATTWLFYWIGNDMQKYNAKLIVCAPEMLEMLKDILDDMENDKFEISVNQIYNLIKKATL